jgi:hypothetical protein
MDPSQLLIDPGLRWIYVFLFTETENFILIKRHDRGHIIQRRVLVKEIPAAGFPQNLQN